MEFEATIEAVGKSIDAAGVAIVVVGSLLAVVPYAVGLARQGDSPESYERVRRNLGRAILLGLEFLIAGDIIRTVAISPTFGDVGVLAGIVLVRTFLSTTLEVEINGRWPWARRRETANVESGSRA